MFSSILVSSLFFAQIPQIQPVYPYSLASLNQNSDLEPQYQNSQILENLIKNQRINDVSLSGKYLNQVQLVEVFHSVVDSLNHDDLSSQDLDLLKQLRGKFINELITLENCYESDYNCSYYVSNINFLLNKTINIYSKHKTKINKNIDKNFSKINSRKINLNQPLIGNNKLKINGSISELDYPLQVPNELQSRYFSRDAFIFLRELNIKKLSYNIPLNGQMNLTFSLIGNEMQFLNKKNPLTRLIPNGGITLNYRVNDSLSWVTGYYGGELKARKLPFEGFWQGNSSFVSQLKFEPHKSLSLGFLYVYSQNNSRLRIGGSQRSQLNLKNKIAAHSYGFDLRWQLHPQISVGGWIGFTDATVSNLGQAEIWNYALTLGINDFNQKGDVLGITIGQPPRLTGTSGFKINGSRKDSDNFWLGEVFYRYPIAKNFSLTPSFTWISNPKLKNTQDNWQFNLKMNIKF